MELIRGRAALVSATNSVSSSGSGNSLSVYTTHLVSFSLSGREVRIDADDPPVIREGDDVVVVGEVDATGVVRPIAHINVTRGVGNSSGGPFLWMAGAVLLLSLAAVFLGGAVVIGAILGYHNALDSETLGYLLISVIASIPFTWGGRWLWRRGMRVSTALKMIRAASLGSPSRAR